MTFRNLSLSISLTLTISLTFIMFNVFKPMTGDDYYYKSFLQIKSVSPTQIDPGVLQMIVKNQAESNSNTDSLSGIQGASSNAKINEFISLLKEQLGKKYVFGATGPNTFDCSGLVMYCYDKTMGTNVCPRSTYDQANFGTKVELSDIQPGDIIIEHPDRGHVVVYIGNGEVLHAPHTGDVVKIAPLEGYHESQVNIIRRIF